MSNNHLNSFDIEQPRQTKRHKRAAPPDAPTAPKAMNGNTRRAFDQQLLINERMSQNQ